jgi:protein arginine kinase activator
VKCEACHSAEATVQVKQVADGQVKEVFLCPVCAEKSGLKSPAAMADFLFGVGSPVFSDAALDAHKGCPVCHMRGSDFRKTSRLGCEHCYETFADELVPMIETMHRSFQHRGKTPAHEQTRVQIALLQARLRNAVERQAFEEAAGIRDEIKALEVQVA